MKCITKKGLKIGQQMPYLGSLRESNAIVTIK